jgi:isopentenyl diphosphate isomerase/L-lactate dehydrogenase-like FMN-dependent dehydrogenase
MQYAIAAGGEDGLRKLGDVFAAETNLTLAQIGRRNMQDLKGCIAD